MQPGFRDGMFRMTSRPCPIVENRNVRRLAAEPLGVGSDPVRLNRQTGHLPAERLRVASGESLKRGFGEQHANRCDGIGRRLDAMRPDRGHPAPLGNAAAIVQLGWPAVVPGDRGIERAPCIRRSADQFFRQAVVVLKQHEAQLGMIFRPGGTALDLVPKALAELPEIMQNDQEHDRLIQCARPGDRAILDQMIGNGTYIQHVPQGRMEVAVDLLSGPVGNLFRVEHHESPRLGPSNLSQGQAEVGPSNLSQGQAEVSIPSRNCLSRPAVRVKRVHFESRTRPRIGFLVLAVPNPTVRHPVRDCASTTSWCSIRTSVALPISIRGDFITTATRVRRQLTSQMLWVLDCQKRCQSVAAHRSAPVPRADPCTQVLLSNLAISRRRMAEKSGALRRMAPRNCHAERPCRRLRQPHAMSGGGAFPCLVTTRRGRDIRESAPPTSERYGFAKPGVLHRAHGKCAASSPPLAATVQGVAQGFPCVWAGKLNPAPSVQIKLHGWLIRFWDIVPTATRDGPCISSISTNRDPATPLSALRRSRRTTSTSFSLSGCTKANGCRSRPKFPA